MELTPAPPDTRRSAAAGWAKLRAGDSRGAANEFRTALAQDPENIDALTGLCQALLNTNDLNAASEHVRDLVRLAPQLAASHRLHALVLRRRHPFKALEAAREAVRLDPDEAYGYHVLAACQHGLGRRRNALKTVAEGRATAPANAILMAQEARLTLETRGPRAAAPLIEEALGEGLERFATRLSRFWIPLLVEV